MLEMRRPVGPRGRWGWGWALHLPVAAALCATSAVAQPNGETRGDQARPLEHVALVVTPSRFDPLPVLAALDKEKLHPDRVIVQVLDCGQTAYATESNVFIQAPALVGKDVVGDVGVWCKKRGIECWAALDLLRWWSKKDPQEFDPFDKHPELLAQGFRGALPETPQGKFASPFNPETRKALVQAVGELAAMYPDFDGLLLQCRLPRYVLLGSDPASRAAYVGSAGVDPQSLPLTGGRPEADPRVAQFYRWRTDAVSSLVAEVTGAYRKACPNGRIAALGLGDRYGRSPTNQAETCDDWVQWVRAGHVDEVVIDAVWKDGWGERAWTAATKAAAAAGKQFPLTGLLSARPLYRQYNLMQGWLGFRERGTDVRRLIVDPYYERCTGDGLAILKQTMRWRRLPK